MRAGRPRAAHARVGARARPQRRAGLRNEQSGWWKVALATGRYREGGQSRSLHRFARMPAARASSSSAEPLRDHQAPARIDSARTLGTMRKANKAGMAESASRQEDESTARQRPAERVSCPVDAEARCQAGPWRRPGRSHVCPSGRARGPERRKKRGGAWFFARSFAFRRCGLRRTPFGIRPQTRRRGGCQAIGETLASEAVRACRPGKRPSPRRARAPIRPRAVQASGPAPPRRPRGPASHCPSAAGLCHDAATAG